MALVHSHMRAVCLQSLSSDRELQGEEVEVEEAISCLSRFEQTSEGEREGGEASARLKCRVIKCRKREREMTGCQGLKS